ncbi:hypothetical protein HK102_014002, partial [Quaeritorhiza haematococci]
MVQNLVMGHGYSAMQNMNVYSPAMIAGMVAEQLRIAQPGQERSVAQGRDEQQQQKQQRQRQQQMQHTTVPVGKNARSLETQSARVTPDGRSLHASFGAELAGKSKGNSSDRGDGRIENGGVFGLVDPRLRNCGGQEGGEEPIERKAAARGYKGGVQHLQHHVEIETSLRGGISASPRPTSPQAQAEQTRKYHIHSHPNPEICPSISPRMLFEGSRLPPIRESVGSLFSTHISSLKTGSVPKRPAFDAMVLSRKVSSSSMPIMRTASTSSR